MTPPTHPRLIILGAGPAGVGAAFQLSKQGYTHVTVLERNRVVGGNAGTFEISGLKVDYGSHRLHPSCHPRILKDIQTLLGRDLLDRPRHGRIRLQGRWVHFPLKGSDLIRRLPIDFTLGVLKDLVRKWVPRSPVGTETETFASILEKGLGETICRDFYFPYAKKLWGLEPTELALTQAKRRVGANSLGKMIRKVLSAVPGFKPPGAGRFFYPKQGFGQITDAMFHTAQSQGVQFFFGATVRSLHHVNGVIQSVSFDQDGDTKTLECDQVWSTLPITVIARGLCPGVPESLHLILNKLEYRSMILIYLVLEAERFTEFDAHYFPETAIRISRLSEPKNYSLHGPAGLTVLCAELPCSLQDPEWSLPDDELGQVVCEALQRVGIPVTVPIKEVCTRRVPYAYPIYRHGYETTFDQIDQYLHGLSNLLYFGRQGLFAHDNTHHALHMAYSAVECIQSDGSFDWSRWALYRKEFESHVVED